MMGDPHYGRRVLIAFACAIALHEILAAFVRAPSLQRAGEEPVRVSLVTIARRPVPTPTPTRAPTPRSIATPSPAPQPTITPWPRATIALVTATHPAPRAIASPHPHRIAGGDIATYDAAREAGRAARLAGTAGAGVSNGAGGRNGVASGIEGSGNGSGAAPAQVPCGSPSLIGSNIRFVDGRYYVNVEAQITFRDGHVESGHFPYPFVYDSEDADPFTERNKDKDAYLQFPPPGVDMSDAPQAVLIAIKYTRPNGMTLLPPC